jgi:hypothetical protein
MKRAFLIFALVLFACHPVPAQNLPPFLTTDDAKEWLYTVKPTQLLDYLLWASKIENIPPIITTATMNYLLMRDRSLYITPTSPMTIKFGGDLITMSINIDPVTVKDFAPAPPETDWGKVALGGGVVLSVGVIIGVLLRGAFP